MWLQNKFWLETGVRNKIKWLPIGHSTSPAACLASSSPIRALLASSVSVPSLPDGPSQQFRVHPERDIPAFPQESVWDTPGVFLGFETTCLGLPDPFLNYSQSFPKRPAGISRAVPCRLSPFNTTRSAIPTAISRAFPGRPVVVSRAVPMPAISVQRYQKRQSDRDIPSFLPAFGGSIPGYPRAACD